MRFSLYPGYALVHAVRACVLAEADSVGLCSHVSDVLRDQNLSNCGIDVNKLIAEFGVNIWGRLYSISNSLLRLCYRLGKNG